MPKVKVEICHDYQGSSLVPTDQQLIDWAQAAVADEEASVSVVLLDIEPMRNLNSKFRNTDRATNVLAFPSDAPVAVAGKFLGDVIISPDVINEQAQQQNKNALDHFAHMVIHGCLHLQGYDHINAVDAAAMEAKETELLATFGVDNPYGDDDHD